MRLHVVMTDSLLRELAEGIGSRTFMPVFGEVHLGVLNGVEKKSFGDGEPHYGMVRGGLAGRPEQPLVPFAPITSRKTNRLGALHLPKGVLPPKEGKGMVDSYVLLFWRSILIPASAVRTQFQKRATLVEPYVTQARVLIRKLRRR
jgi:hypothetical protein